MAWLDGMQDIDTARERTEKALRAQIGLMSPLWVAFGAAASAGVAWWWMTRWAKPVNLEAEMGASIVETPVEPEASLEAEPAVGVEAEAVVEPPTEQPLESVAHEEAAPEADPAMVESEPEAPTADDLTRLVGIGPKIAKALEARGVTRFTQLAAWSDEDLAEFDAALDLKGKTIRAGLVAQARRLIADET
jgi:predicted flap endonuclease-1-like 5' DNA nuclease